MPDGRCGAHNLANSCVYLISTWFIRYDTGKRYGVFYLIGSLASALSGILAYGLSQMNGLGGYTGWRWVCFLLVCLFDIVR